MVKGQKYLCDVYNAQVHIHIQCAVHVVRCTCSCGWVKTFNQRMLLWCSIVMMIIDDIENIPVYSIVTMTSDWIDQCIKIKILCIFLYHNNKGYSWHPESLSEVGLTYYHSWVICFEWELWLFPYCNTCISYGQFGSVWNRTECAPYAWVCMTSSLQQHSTTCFNAVGLGVNGPSRNDPQCTRTTLCEVQVRQSIDKSELPYKATISFPTSKLYISYHQPAKPYLICPPVCLKPLKIIWAW